jgi:predicted AAA+ superfamily ATPase
MTAEIGRLFVPPRGSYFLFGPRGSGKSTWLRHLYADAHWVDLLDEGRYQRYLVDPGLFSAELEACPRGSFVVVDEVQRLPGLLNVVHQKIETRRLRFALSGSSARKLRRSGVNLLAGRAVRRALHPFVPEELGARFSLGSTLEFGALPIVWGAEDRRDALDAYVQLYLKEEIQAEAATRNLAGFARFLPIAGLFHGQTLNIAALARDAGVARTTVQGYLEILEDTLFTFRVPAYEARLRVRERRHPKLYWVDPGLVRAVVGDRGAPDAESMGRLLEGWVAQLLRAYRDYRGICDDLAYWAPAEARGTEVDFLLRRGRERIAIEVKASRRWKAEFAKGLRAIEDLRGLTRRIVVYLGAERLRPEKGIEVLPLDAFLSEVARGLG